MQIPLPRPFGVVYPAHMQTFGERSRASDGHIDANVRMTVREAADALGVTVEAVRGRMYRGRYGKVKDDEGRVWVLLSPDQLPNGRGEVYERSSKRSGTSLDERSPTDEPNVYKLRDFDAEELVEELRGEVAYLKDVVATRDDELRRKDTIIMQMAQRIPELSPVSSQGPRDDHAETAPDGSVVEEGREGSQSGLGRPSWWRRLFGG